MRVPHRLVAVARRIDVGDRVGIEVDQPADAVPAAARAEEGQHEERPVADAPLAERLAEILVVLFDAGFGRDVEEAQHARPCVDRDAADVGYGLR